MDMNYEQILQLIERLENSSLSKISWRDGEQELTLEKAPAVYPSAGPMPAPLPAGVPMQAAAPDSTVSCPPASESASTAALVVVKAPLVGTFYRASSPDSKPFVSVGERVKKGQTVCLIEAMKMMNEITAPADGVVADILVQNGEIVAFDAPLMQIDPS